jgi:hypothetical protein
MNNAIYEAMQEVYKIKDNGLVVWLEIPEEEEWDSDVYKASRQLENVIYYTPEVADLIYLLQLDMVVETNHEYWPYVW